MKKTKFLLLFATMIAVSGCSSTLQKNSLSDIEINDPYEDMNRKVFAFNIIADKHVIHPVINGYRKITPKPARTGLSNFLRNLRSPIDFTNQLLQFDLKGAGTIFTRTAINSTLGLGGIIDVAAHEGIKYEFEDFGQTLAVWGVPHGPYFMLPLVGPSSMRDYTGYLTDSFIDPVRLYAFNVNKKTVYFSKFALDYFTLRESLIDVQKDLEVNSIDYYAALRSIYYQRRAALVKDQNAENAQDSFEIPDYDDFEFEDE